MISRIYRWRVPVPAGRTTEDALLAASAAAERVSRFNPNVETAEVYADPDGDLRVSVQFAGRDQWWIKKKVVFAIGGILAQSKIPVRSARLEAIDRLADRRSVRERASDGRSNPLPEDVDIDHSDMGLEIA